MDVWEMVDAERSLLLDKLGGISEEAAAFLGGFF